MSKPYHILIAGGGTGGHIFPAVAIAGALTAASPGIRLLFVGAKGKMEMEQVPRAGYEIRGLDIAGFNRSSIFRNATLPLKLIKSFIQVRSILNDFKPDAVVGVGGYSTYPVLRASQARGIPTFIHESNSFAGKANILLGKRATAIFTGAPGLERFFPASKISLTGNPVRKNITSSAVPREEALASFGLSPDKPVLFVTGGSLGARSINEVLLTHVRDFVADGIQVIWQTGKTDSEKYLAATQGLPGVWTNEFITDMSLAYRSADVVISRSGAMTVAELCVCGKAAIMVPYPHSAEDHQTHNAMTLVKADAGIMIRNSDAPNELYPAALALLKDPQRRVAMAENIRRFAVMDADEAIAKKILEYLNAGKP